MVKIRGVIFDLDGTLIDSLEAFIDAFNQGTAGFGLAPVSRDRLASFLNRATGLERILTEIFPDVFKDDEVRHRCLEKIGKAYLDIQKQTVVLKPGAKAVLLELKEMGLKMGIVTGRTTSGEAKWLELRRLGIDGFFDSLITGADAPRKPAADGIIKCLQEMGISAEECVMVGDSQADIITGKAAGVTTIAIASGVASKEAFSSVQPDMEIRNLAELPARISELQSLA